MSYISDAPLLDPETVARIERENTTVGQYERLAGIGQSHEERLAFWLQFKHEDGHECIRLGDERMPASDWLATASATENQSVPVTIAVGSVANSELGCEPWS